MAQQNNFLDFSLANGAAFEIMSDAKGAANSVNVQTIGAVLAVEIRGVAQFPWHRA